MNIIRPFKSFTHRLLRVAFTTINTLIFIFLLSSLLCPIQVHAAPLEIYVVDIQKVLDESIAGKRAHDKILKSTAENKTRMRKIQGDLEALQRTLVKQKSILSQEAFEQKAYALQKKKKDFARDMRDISERIQRDRASAIEKIIVKIQEILPKLAKEKNAPVIIEKDQRFVTYVHPDYEITEDLISLLNKTSIS